MHTLAALTQLDTLKIKLEDEDELFESGDIEELPAALASLSGLEALHVAARYHAIDGHEFNMLHALGDVAERLSRLRMLRLPHPMFCVEDGVYKRRLQEDDVALLHRLAKRMDVALIRELPDDPEEDDCWAFVDVPEGICTIRKQAGNELDSQFAADYDAV